jgi:hypothetical protein
MQNEGKLTDYQARRTAAREAEEKEFPPVPTQLGKKASESGNAQAPAGVPDIHTMIGYMPKRGDFD